MTNGESERSRGKTLVGLRILVVEDEFFVAMEIKAILTDAGCDVIGPASRLPKASRLAREERLDGAILDINIDGQKINPVARELRERGVPIILLTGYGAASVEEDLRSECRLDKPFDAEELKRLAASVFIRN